MPEKPQQTHAQRVGAAVRQLMTHRALTQFDMAKVIERSQAAASRRLLGLVPFDVEELHTVAAWLDVPPASLLDPAAEDEPTAIPA